MTNIFLYGFGCLLLLSITALAAVETNDDGKSLENLITESLQPSLDLKGLSRQRRQLNGISALTLASAGLASTTGVLGIVIGKAHGRKHARHRRRPAYNYAYTTSAHGRYRGKRSVDVKEGKPTESLVPESVQPTDVESRQINGISALALAAAGVATTTGVLGLAIGKAYGRKHPVKHHHHHHGHKEHRPRPTYSAYSAPSYRSKRSADKVEEEDEDEAAIIRMAVMMDQQSGGCVARLLCQLHQQQLMDQQFQQRLMALNDEDPDHQRPSKKEMALIRSSGSMSPNLEVCDQVFHRCHMRDRNLINSKNKKSFSLF